MKNYLVLSYDMNELDTKEPRILYSGSNELMAKQLLEDYRLEYKGYRIVLAEVSLA